MMYKDSNPEYLINTNQQIELFQHLKDLLMCNYLVKAKFVHLGFNGDEIQCNNKVLVCRKKKFGPLHFREGVKVIEHNLWTNSGGSHKNPSIGSKGSYAILEFVSEGLPNISEINGWSIEVLNIEKTELKPHKVKYERMLN